MHKIYESTAYMVTQIIRLKSEIISFIQLLLERYVPTKI